TAAILTGAALSYLLADPRLAFASAAAFGAAELADMLVYAPLRRRGLLLAVFASNAVGLGVDSWLFLQLAFGDLQYLPGQILAKTYMTILAAIVLAVIVRHRMRSNPPVVGEPCHCTTLERALCGHCRHDLCEDCKQCTGAGHERHECIALTVS
ncbi:MAG: VUT family protein, partial [Hyphomicrobiales bacterium]